MTLLETMVALVILGVATVGYLEVVAAGARTMRRTAAWSLAVTYAEDLLERSKTGSPVPDAARPEETPDGFARWVDRAPWGDSLVVLTARVRLPDGARFQMPLLTRAP